MSVSEKAAPPRVRRLAWQRAYGFRLLVSDTVVVASAVTGSQLLWFGADTPNLDGAPGSGFGYTTVSVAVVLAWLFILRVFETRDPKVIGSGTLEYKRVADSTIRLFGVLALLAYLFDIGLARGYFLTALPLGLGLLIYSRWVWRQWLRRQQSRGDYLSRAVLVGEHKNSFHVATMIKRAGGTGLSLVGTFTASGETPRTVPEDLPVLGAFHEILHFVDEQEIDTIILTGTDDLSPEGLRQLGWDLETRNVELIVAPALTDIAGPRIHARPVAGLPLIHVEYPNLAGVSRLSKRAFDMFASLAMLIAFSPMLLGVAIAVKTTSPGQLIYTQERIGKGGVPFGMLKFRSMVPDADDQLESLLDAQGSSGTPLFKVTNDPRITPVGRFIRKYSLDEFPQLVNVLRGQMSLVGPRPQRAAEVALYDLAAHRRLIMKPGMSGLWQVSGRSNLSWEESIRLDLAYVENWSMTGDILILVRTFRAIIKHHGAV